MLSGIENVAFQVSLYSDVYNYVWIGSLEHLNATFILIHCKKACLVRDMDNSIIDCY